MAVFDETSYVFDEVDGVPSALEDWCSGAADVGGTRTSELNEDVGDSKLVVRTDVVGINGRATTTDEVDVVV